MIDSHAVYVYTSFEERKYSFQLMEAIIDSFEESNNSFREASYMIKDILNSTYQQLNSK
jgi:hypothetical protein